MTIAPIHPREADRLEDLRALSILDTPPEERFERFVRLARQIFNIPIAYVSLVDENRQWLKAHCGMAVSETERDISFCAHTILRDEPLIIQDATKDPRFAANPMVTGAPRIRFYAGHPLKGPGGHNVGTLCIADTSPRAFSERELSVFKELALATERELNLADVVKAQQELLAITRALARTRERLATELSDAARYVRSLIPAPIRAGQIRTDWAYAPSSILGGDILGYQWLDERRFAFYLIDVCGHGVASALLSTSIVSTLRRGDAAGLNLADPAQTLTSLNRLFPMEEHNNRFFTAWYGVYDRADGQLAYASGGHPPAIRLARADGSSRDLTDHVADSIGTPSFMLGIEPDVRYEARTVPVRPSDALYVFSDGVYETRMPGGRMLERDGLTQLLSHASRAGQPADSRVDRVVEQIKGLRGQADFEDDFTLLEVEFAG